MAGSVEQAVNWTPRGTILSGRLDCYVRKADSVPFVIRGRVSSLEEASLVDCCLDLCPPRRRANIAGLRAMPSDDFVDALITLRSAPIARKWLREMVMAGLSELRRHG
jgi:hypothetical protein